MKISINLFMTDAVAKRLSLQDDFALQMIAI